MALFGTLNVAGPANRQGTIQQLAQEAANSVVRRQRLKSLLQQATVAGGGTHTAAGVPLQSSMRGHVLGTRGAVMRPSIAADQLAQMARSAGRAGHLPGGAVGGVYGAGGGGFDFGALPAAVDHSQSQAEIGPTPFHSVPSVPPGQVNNPGQGGSAPQSPPMLAPTDPSSITQDITNVGDGSMPPGVHGWIPLGGGIFYDPVNDIVRGSGNPGNGLVGQDGKF